MVNSNFINKNQKIDVRSFVAQNITPYDGDASFLTGATQRTKDMWNICLDAIKEERANKGVRAIDNELVSTITSHAAGYIDRDNELIVGLQTDLLLKRAMKPYGGFSVVERACNENGVEVSPMVKEVFTKYAKTHNDGVFNVYTPEIRTYRSLGILTGLPDNYARGRIIGDYRRLALYGTTTLIEAKQADLKGLNDLPGREAFGLNRGTLPYIRVWTTHRHGSSRRTSPSPPSARSRRRATPS